MRDYVLASLPEQLDERLRDVAADRGISPEQAAVELLAGALGVEDQIVYVDLEELELVR